MNRSKRFAIVSFCTLAQGVRAAGIVKHFPAVVKPIVDVLVENDINIVQMPCPELYFDSFTRQPCGKSKYDNPKNRSMCKKLAENLVSLVQIFHKNGCYIEVILGIEFSPSCAVSILTAPPPQRRIAGQGIFIEELKKVLHERHLKIPMLGIQIYRIEKSVEDLKNILGRRRLI